MPTPWIVNYEGADLDQFAPQDVDSLQGRAIIHQQVDAVLDAPGTKIIIQPNS
jgi:hypothetical protein